MVLHPSPCVCFRSILVSPLIQTSSSRRVLLSTSILSLGASVLQSAASKAEDVNKPSQPSISPPMQPPSSPPPPVEAASKMPEVVNVEISSRIYDATAIGEPMAVGKDKRKVWEKLMNAQIVYLGESEQVLVKDDKELELEIVKNLRMIKIDGEALKASLLHWPPERWQEYEPLLSYCRDNGRLIQA